MNYKTNKNKIKRNKLHLCYYFSFLYFSILHFDTFSSLNLTLDSAINVTKLYIHVIFISENKGSEIR